MLCCVQTNPAAARLKAAQLEKDRINRQIEKGQYLVTHIYFVNCEKNLFGIMRCYRKQRINDGHLVKYLETIFPC